MATSEPDLGSAFHALRLKLEAISHVTSIEVSDEFERGRGLPGATFEVTLTEGTQRIDIEAKNSGEPRFIREASFFLADRGRAYPGSYGVVVAPYISPESRAILRSQGQGWMDLAGNCFLSFTGIHIEIEKTDVNPFGTRRKQRSVFSPKSSRILKVLLAERRPLRGNEIASRAHVSTAQVSKIREVLIDREWATSDASGLRVVKPIELLQAWREERQAPDLLAQGYTVYHGAALDTHIQTLFMKAKTTPFNTLLLAGHSVARRIAPYTRVPGEFFYADRHSLELLEDFLRLEPSDMGANVFVYEPEDDMMQLDSIAISPDPIRGTGLIQTYLDLSAMGDRDREAADHLFSEKLARALGTGVSRND
ncbi:hypothetical protein CY658_24695 [Variovorax sp. RO1]|uniref:hypothetical protein n=1 Tax=Variovorax sp. RO1 TaxID=2066034 RepID=UPI000C718382|nr:hypothetical protein [Variovorax sp. RO1]PLC03090.1 hypothetical protein CY658_24695 [Variovorax sp. RO1]